MLNLLTSSQTREADQFTIEKRSMSSIELMEAAAKAFINAFWAEAPSINTSVSVYCGTGNNGGDGLAIACLLKDADYDVNVKILRHSPNSSANFDTYLKRIGAASIPVTEITNSAFPEENADIIIDAVLGSGLNKSLAGDVLKLTNHINSLNKKVVAVDVPTGFKTEGAIEPDAVTIIADNVITFQRPKINFFFPESEKVMRSYEVVDIGLDEGFIQSLQSDWKLIEQIDVQSILKSRKQFSHKGTYGHALIIAGKKETMGAALLCAEASLYAGSGLTTACIPEAGLTALNTRIPEAMSLIRDEGSFNISDSEKYNAIAIGPGLGTDKPAIKILKDLLKLKRSLLLDADALNMMASESGLIKKLSENSIITPHLKEFDRLFGKHKNWWERLETAQKQAFHLKIVIILKNRYTFIVTPDKQILINQTGSPAMATGGMGDVLTGMIVSFLAQGYSSTEAAILGCYIHGSCGQDRDVYVIPASRLIQKIPGKIIEIFGQKTHFSRRKAT